MPKFERILFVAFDHLSQNHGVLKAASPSTDAVVLVESQRMIQGRNWHKERLFFLISSARHFAKRLESQGFTVRYLQCATTVAGLKQAREEFGELPIISSEPSSYRQYASLKEFGVQFIENDYFLTSREHFKLWADKQKTFVMENF